MHLVQRVDAAQAGADDQDVIVQAGILVEVRRCFDAAHVVAFWYTQVGLGKELDRISQIR